MTNYKEILRLRSLGIAPETAHEADNPVEMEHTVSMTA